MSKIKTNGELLVYCWALEQEKSRRGYKSGDEQDVLVPWVTQKKLSKGTNKSSLRDQSDQGTGVEAPVVEKTVNYRYYHLYRQGELEQDIGEVPGCVISKAGYEKDNWWAIIRKNSD